MVRLLRVMIFDEIAINFDEAECQQLGLPSYEGLNEAGGSTAKMVHLHGGHVKAGC